jgi:hypothetical protein
MARAVRRDWTPADRALASTITEAEERARLEYVSARILAAL